MSLSRHTGYNLIGSVVPIILSLITVPLYLKLVGMERYGVLAIAWLLLGYFGLFDLGLGRATSFRIASLKNGTPQQRADAFWSAIVVNVGMGLVGGAILWIAASYFFGHLLKVDEHLRPEMLAAAPLLALGVPEATAIGVLTGALQGRGRFFETNMNSILSTALFQCLPLAVAWWFGPNLVWLLSAALLARALGAVSLFWRCWQNLVRGQTISPHRSEILTLLGYGGWVNIASIFGPILYMIDRFVIGAQLGASAVTSYTVPVQLTQRITILPSSLITALFPRLSAASPDERRELSERAMRTLAGLLIVPYICAIFVIGPFLALWIGQRIGTSAPMIGRVLIVGMFANALAQVASIRLQASGRPDLVTKTLMCEIPPYLFLLYLGIHFLGMTGAAIATAIRYFVDFLLLTWVAGPSARGRGLLGFMFGFLMLGVWFAGLWSFNDWRWWVSGGALISAGALAGLMMVPESIRQKFILRARIWSGLAPALARSDHER